jgi:RNA polymerase-binding protein DksA
MAKAKQRSSSAGSSARGGKRFTAKARERQSLSERRTAAKTPPKKSPARPVAASRPTKPAKRPPAAKSHAPKSEKVIKKPAVPVKSGGSQTRKGPPTKVESKSHAKSSREIVPVKERGSDGRVAAAAKLAVAKAKDGKAKAPVEKGAKGADGRAGKELVAKDAKGKPVKGKGPVVPPPPRKIQVVQLSSLKPGARGTRAVLARRPDELDDRSQTNGAKKRRSAELTSQQILHFRELLEQRRHRLSSDLTLMQDEALKVTGQDNSADSVADAGTDNYEQDFTLGLIESEEALAREVDEALMRIERNAFGVCESCETPIPLARLEILPFTRCCVDCQQKREGRP